uniref:Uncharacterized protein n=1 Tax=Opuntia streptacantha TaxID=393608 RepID=A0A7C9AJM1_OPUST
MELRGHHSSYQIHHPQGGQRDGFWLIPYTENSPCSCSTAKTSTSSDHFWQTPDFCSCRESIFSYLFSLTIYDPPPRAPPLRAYCRHLGMQISSLLSGVPGSFCWGIAGVTL